MERSEEMFCEQAVLLDAEREMLTLEKEKSGKLAEEGSFSGKTGIVWGPKSDAWPSRSRK